MPVSSNEQSHLSLWSQMRRDVFLLNKYFYILTDYFLESFNEIIKIINIYK